MSDPTGPNHAADQAWFHAQVDPVVDAEPIADAWAEIAARADGAPAPAPRPASADRPVGLRWMAAAAVLALLAGIAVVVAATRSDDATSVTADRSADPTGWYIPTGLPDGWTLVAAWVVDDPGLCTQVERSWGDSRIIDPGRGLTLSYDACGTTKPGTLPVDPAALGVDVEMVAADEIQSVPDTTALRWQTDEGAWSLLLSAAGTSEERLAQLEAAARAVMADPQADAPLDHLVVVSFSYVPGSGPGPNVMVQLRPPSTRLSPDHRSLHTYRLTAPGSGPPADPFSVTVPVDPDDLPDQPLPVMLRTADADSYLPDTCCFATSRYLGQWPGADLDVPRWVSLLDPPDPETAEFDTSLAESNAAEIVNALRPATAEEWRSYLATAENSVDPALLTAPDVRSIGDVATVPEETTTQADAVPTTTASGAETVPETSPHRPPAVGAVTSEPGEVRERVETDPNQSSLDGLEFRFEIDSTWVRAGQPVGATLLVHNTTDHLVELNECTVGPIRWGLVPVDQPDQDLAQRAMIDCYDTPLISVEPRSTERYPLGFVDETFIAQRLSDDGIARGLGTLPGGDYLAAVEISGDRTTVRITLPVQVPDPPCDTSDALAARYLGLTSAEAADEARADGLELRPVRIDGRSQGIDKDLRCDRINLELWSDRITSVLRY